MCFVVDLLQRVVMSSTISLFDFCVNSLDSKILTDKINISNHILSNHICQYLVNLEF